MIHLDEIKQRKEEGKRKYGKALLNYIEPKIKDGYSYSSIVKWLKEEHDFIITEKKIGQLRYKYKGEIHSNQDSKGLSTRKSESNFEKIVQNKERKTVIVPLKEQSPDEIKESFFSMMDDEINKVPSPFDRLIKK